MHHAATKRKTMGKRRQQSRTEVVFSCVDKHADAVGEHARNNGFKVAHPVAGERRVHLSAALLPLVAAGQRDVELRRRARVLRPLRHGAEVVAQRRDLAGARYLRVKLSVRTFTAVATLYDCICVLDFAY